MTSAPKCPQTLYKYVSPDRIDVLENSSIRFTQPAAFNDPFEFSPHITGLANEKLHQEIYDEVFDEECKKAWDMLTDAQKTELPFLDFKKMFIEFVGPPKVPFAEFSKLFVPEARSRLISAFKQIGILSLSESCSSLLMWSHYGQSHTGFVIGFDPTHTFFNSRRSITDEFYHLQKIKYATERPSALLSEHDSASTFYTKSSDWAYEREWRSLRPISDSHKVLDITPHPIHLYNFPDDCVTKIILGLRISEENRFRLLELSTGFPRAKMYTAGIHPSKFRLYISKYKNSLTT